MIFRPGERRQSETSAITMRPGWLAQAAFVFDDHPSPEGAPRGFLFVPNLPWRDSEYRFDFILGCLLYGYYTVYYFMSPPNSAQRYDFTGLTPNDYMDMDLSSIFGLNSRFGAVLGVIWRFFAH